MSVLANNEYSQDHFLKEYEPMSLSIAIIGAGAMGGAMAKCLLAAGHSVFVRDIRAEREQILTGFGATAVSSPAQAAAQAKTLFIVVVDGGEIEEVLWGAPGKPSGLLSALTSEHTVLFNSTIAPEDVQRFCEAVQATGAHAVDAPISGGPVRAAAGTMSMMLAAPATVLARIETLLGQMTAKRFVISERFGDGAKAKLTNNLMAGLNLLAGAEALAFGERLGLDAQQLLNLMSVSSGQSWMADDRLTRALVNDFEPRAQTKVITKDVRLANELAQRQGLDLPLGNKAAKLYAEACAAGFDLEDDAAVLKHYRRLFQA
jgi:L-threonate 2-dehydrogenase